jgi:hypothetical protein
MSEEAKPDRISVPVSLVAPVRLGNVADEQSCGLFFPHRTNLSLALAIDWDGEKHLIHLEGAYAFNEGKVGTGNPIFGVVIKSIEYQVDATSHYDSAKEFDPAGALVLKGGELFLYCRKLGDQFLDDPHPVPLGAGYLPGGKDEACGFTRWSVVVREGNEIKVIRSFEAHPKT